MSMSLYLHAENVKMKKISFSVVILVGCLLLNSCASTNGTQSLKGKKIQSGKPIPCPAKDCD